MNPITKPQLQRIAITCNKLGIAKEQKQMMVSGFSAGRCTSSTGLTYVEAVAMIQHLSDLSNESNKHNRKMIGKIFYYAHEMGWEKINKAGKLVADGKRIDEWMKKYSYKKKRLSDYAEDELPKLVSQFEQVYKHHLS